MAQLLLEIGGEWDRHLDIATFLYNVNYHDTIMCSPFYAVDGYWPLTPGVLQWLPSPESTLQQKLRIHRELLQNLQVRIQKSRERYKQIL